ncbi:alpha/beta hydrolase [Streptomyces sp. NBC_00280]|uniref:alpha/beta hydrolase n=1 Tax=Streptomyces sp. NBC_00280 TaxID=2975699 RepID=UPI00324D2950
MATATQVPHRGARGITLRAGDVPLSALLCEPEDGNPRATVVALHGLGMNAGYFDGRAHPDVSLLALGARLGFTVLAVDRPGYGRSARLLPEGQSLREQALTVCEGLEDFGTRYATGAGTLLLAHSFGGKLALTVAADSPLPGLIGLDVSGCGHRYAVASKDVPGALAEEHWRQNWGRLGLYPPDTFRSSSVLTAPAPVRERGAAADWPDLFAELAPRIRVPVRFTFAQHELWWRQDTRALDDLTALLTSAPRVLVDRQPDAGHNISLGWAARAYHLRALGFLEECLSQRGGT